MPVKQSKIEEVKKQLEDMNPDELKQVRDYSDNRLSEIHPDYTPTKQANDLLADMDDTELAQMRDTINERLMEKTDTTVGSADASADDEKRKYIAQHGADPNAQETAQAVPQPESNEVKDLQNEASEAEHQAKGGEEHNDAEKADRIQEAASR